MSDSGVTFIRKNGRIIPIREKVAHASNAATAAAAGGAYAIHRKMMKKPLISASAKNSVKSAGAKLGGKLAKLHKQTRFAHGVAVGAGAALAAQHGTFKSTNPEVKVNQKLNLLGLGLSIGTGLLGAATLSGGAKRFLAGAAVTHAIDAAGVGLNVASVAGKGHKLERAKLAAKQEARNFAIGNAVFVAGAVATKSNRAALVAGAKTSIKYAGKTLAFARKVLRVGAL